MQLLLSGRIMDLNTPKVMGILNVTPDSFSDGGHYVTLDDAFQHAKAMVAAGAEIVDVGGESTRPGAKPVALQEELDRVIPVVEKLSALNIPVSIDTSKAEVMREAVRAGAAFINDVCALRNPDALTTVAELNVPVCLMHMQGEPRTMQYKPAYQDVINEVTSFLLERVEVCKKAGISLERVILDPGFGFGKTLRHNLFLLKHLDILVDTGFPVLIGFSRKSMISQIIGEHSNAPVSERLSGSLAATIIGVLKGARIIRTHDVKETVEALKVFNAVFG